MQTEYPSVCEYSRLILFDLNARGPSTWTLIQRRKSLATGNFHLLGEEVTESTSSISDATSTPELLVPRRDHRNVDFRQSAGTIIGSQYRKWQSVVKLPDGSSGLSILQLLIHTGLNYRRSQCLAASSRRLYVATEPSLRC